MNRDEIFAELADGQQRVRRTYQGKAPEKLLMSNRVYFELLRAASGEWNRYAYDAPWGSIGYDLHAGHAVIPRIFGMLAELDELTPVWRMLGEGDCLLLDPREGKTLREVLAGGR